MSVEKNYDYVSVSDVLGRPYVYYMFYMKVPPSVFRSTSLVYRDAFGFVTVEKVGKYIFSTNALPQGYQQKKVLYIGDVTNIPHDAHVLKTFYQTDGTPVLSAYTL